MPPVNPRLFGAAQPYRDRREAGLRLAGMLLEWRSRPDVAVFAIPRGGVPVAFEVALKLEAPLDVIVVRKLGHPIQPELAIGAIAEAGICVLNAETRLPDFVVGAVAARERPELQRRVRAYREGLPALEPRGRTVILVDDGVATGSTMLAAVESVRKRGAREVVIATPVGARSTCAELARHCEQLVCPLQPDELVAVGGWYEDFSQTSDADVRDLLAKAATRHIPPSRHETSGRRGSNGRLQVWRSTRVGRVRGT